MKWFSRCPFFFLHHTETVIGKMYLSIPIINKCSTMRYRKKKNKWTEITTEKKKSDEMKIWGKKKFFLLIFIRFQLIGLKSKRVSCEESQLRNEWKYAIITINFLERNLLERWYSKYLKKFEERKTFKTKRRVNISSYEIQLMYFTCPVSSLNTTQLRKLFVSPFS